MRDWRPPTAECFALTKELAPACRTAEGRACCLLCGRTDALILVAPGWGSVWVCRDCDAKARTDL